jgi:hypothetical protein
MTNPSTGFYKLLPACTKFNIQFTKWPYSPCKRHLQNVQGTAGGPFYKMARGPKAEKVPKMEGWGISNHHTDMIKIIVHNNTSPEFEPREN